MNILVFILGAIVGSFLNVCIYRIPKSRSIIFPPSSCPSCSKNIKWYDNIPILSYVILRGRCRSCKARISPLYITVEILTGIMAVCLFMAFGLTPKFFAYLILMGGLIVASFVDLSIQEIPDGVSIGGLAAGIIMSFAFPAIFDTDSRTASIFGSMLGAIAGAGSIYLMGFFGELVFKKEAMGGGDVKLMAAIGAFIGWKLVLFTFFVAPLFGSIAGVVLKIKDGREIIPYGPYLSLAAVVSIFFGNRIMGLLFYGFYQ